MERKILWKDSFRRHGGTLFGILCLMSAVSFLLVSVLGLWEGSERYLREELLRAGYGDLTVWVSQVPDAEGESGISYLAGQVSELSEVSRVESQPVLFASYEIRGQESDSDGQLIFQEPGDDRYRFFLEDLSGYQEESPEIGQGETYVSASLISMFGAQIGDTVTVPVARGGQTITLTIRGFYEDPFMGSSMIGMKGFLIGQEDYESVRQQIRDAGIDALARDGAMLHLFAAEENGTQETAAGLSAAVAEGTDVSRFQEFAYSADAIFDYMIILQTAYSGLFLAFVLVLLFVALVVLSHSVSGAVEQERKDLGILKTLGFTGRNLKGILGLPYVASVLAGLLLGLGLGSVGSGRIAAATLTTTGIRIPVGLPTELCLGAELGILLLVFGFIQFHMRAVGRLRPMEILREQAGVSRKTGRGVRLRMKGWNLSLALRQLGSGRRRYLAAGVTAMLLVFFASLTGHMDSWLGPEGQGMMDAFNPADHDLGVQAMGTASAQEMEELAASFTPITDSYELAMPGVNLGGVTYTANVISDPERFHILEGQTSRAADEIVITETVAADTGLSIGDEVLVGGDLAQETYRVAGIYQCANEMGSNIGMSREGYLRIGADDERLWCHHLFLEDASQKQAIRQALEETYGGDVHVHENSWPGLAGIIRAMDLLLMVMYGGVFAFVLIVTAMTGSKLLRAERRELGIYKAMGFSDTRLRVLFTLRFAITAGIGAAAGTLLALTLTDPVVGAVMRLMGISNFASRPTAGNTLLPILTVVLAFTVFSWLSSGRIRKTDLTELIEGN
ncbi:MAG: FtsX-like permease family protein [Eubacteriales bacterium]|nr:FtsX-like permease family protein [Eubacteriales bacterium]